VIIALLSATFAPAFTSSEPVAEISMEAALIVSLSVALISMAPLSLSILK